MSLTAKIVVSSLGVILLAIGLFLYPIVTNPFYSSLLATSSEQDLKENYQAKAKELRELKAYFNSITPANLSVEIEFEDVDNVDLKVYYPRTAEGQVACYFRQWNFNPYQYEQPAPSGRPRAEYDPETTSLAAVKQRLHWTNDTFREIANHLAKANCLAVRNGEPANISFRFDGLGRYSYNLFDQPPSDSLRQQYARGCTHKPYLPTVILEYGGGAIGPQCFPREPLH